MALQIYISNDHSGYRLKGVIIEWLQNVYKKSLPCNIDDIYIIDMGHGNNDSCDYPHYAHMVSKLVSLNKNSIGIVICGTGIGMSIVCNRYKNIRCALCSNTEMAEMAKKHNDANILALGSRLLSDNNALDILERFLNTDFEGGRHINRIQKINNKNCIDPITFEKNENLI